MSAHGAMEIDGGLDNMKTQYLVTWTEQHSSFWFGESEEEVREQFKEQQTWWRNIKKIKTIKVEEVPHVDDDASRWNDRYGND